MNETAHRPPAPTGEHMTDLVYVVIGRVGEYSDRTEWVAAVFSDKTQAIKVATQKLAESKAYWARWDEWSRCRWTVMGGIANESFLAAVFEKCGPEPASRVSLADDYTVVEVPMNTWGKWECVKSAEET